MARGYLALVLHAHLPFVHHPELDQSLEERWLFEAVTESYLPLLLMLEQLQADGVPVRMTLSLSPTLIAMLDNSLLRDRCEAHLDELTQLADREVRFTAGTAEAALAHYYRNRFHFFARLYRERYGRDLVGAFQQKAQEGCLELITTAATHGFLPLLRQHPEAVRAQIQVGIDAFSRRFGHSPQGFWLPECGYYPGVERFLQEAGVRYCFLESHALFHARPAAPYGPFAHGWTPGGVAVFGRDPASSRQVWSAREGYPGDAAYREFHRDIGFEREPAHLGRLAGPDGVRVFSGLKYHRVTGPFAQKALYDPQRAAETAQRHGAHFVRERIRQVAEIQGVLPGAPPPLLVAPYDAELFGHWWHEGPLFLEHVARQAAAQGDIALVTPSDYLDRFPEGQGRLEPPYSSWGDQGYADFWCHKSNHWLLRPLAEAGRTMSLLADRHPAAGPAVKRALNQAARELLLAQASDWPFLIRAGTAAAYGRQRFESHLERFWHIAAPIRSGTGVSPPWLAQVEAADALFPDLDFRIYSTTFS